MSGILSRRASTVEPSITLSWNTKANQLKEQGEDIIGLAAGQPDFDTPDVIKQGAYRAIETGQTRYTPAAGIQPLRRKIAEFYSERLGVPYGWKETVVSNGAKHTIFNALFAVTDPGDEVLITTPYWVSYPEMVSLVGARPRIVELSAENGYKLTAKRLEKELAAGSPKAILFNSPNNPAGTVYSRAELEPLCRVFLDSGIAVISDEIYEFLVYDGVEHVSPVTLMPELKAQTVVVTGVSKSYAMTGWRIGFGLADEPVAYRMAAYQAHATGCPNSISQWTALEALEKGAGDREMMRVAFEKRMKMFGERLLRIPKISFPAPGGAFYFFVDVSALYDACGVSTSTGFCEKLLAEDGLLVIPGGPFGCDDMIRFSFAASEEELTGALDRFERFVKKYAG
ncbi:MAG: pyridoxal phosphate-dependent aminotransferase [Candidatus Krumholzibacteriota bacterium]|nr:pyridoxal phosphate-dependent aminotransferase [Candidatus Krumholzibacteriota bacterium]